MDIFNFLPDGKLNNLNQAYPFPSTPVNMRTSTNDPANFWAGMLGKVFEFKQADALKLSNTSVGTLYGARFQVVRFKAASTIAPTIGFCAAWNDKDNFIVTPDAVDRSNFAGIYINTPTKGNIGVIAVFGDVEAQFGTITKGGGGAAGDLAIFDAATAKLNVLADATAVTWASLQDMIATLLEAATSDQKKKVRLLFDTHCAKKGIV